MTNSSGTTIDIFISYSTSDSQLAFRLYGDIIKFGGKAYIYEKQSDLAPFPNEIFEKIEKAKAFCLIDSQSARQKEWVRKEVLFALKDSLRYNNGLLFRVLAEPLEKIKHNAHFKKIDQIRTFDFSLSDYELELQKRFDVQDRYYKSVEEICKKIDVPFFHPYPGNHDFQNELNFQKSSGSEAEALQKDMESILLKKKNKYPKIELRLLLLIRDCKKVGTKAITPYLVLGSYYFESDLNEKAKKLFKKLTIGFPNDPRVWLLLSQAYFRQEEYGNALESIISTEDLLKEHPENPHFFKYHQEVIHNKVKLLIILNLLEEAGIAMQQLNPDLMIIPEFKVLRLLLLVKIQEFSNPESQQLYSEIRKFYDDNPRSANEQMLLSELEHEIGKYFYSIHDYRQTIRHYHFALEHSSNNIQYEAELSLVYFITGKFNAQEIKTICEKYSFFQPKVFHEYYYLGLINYLQGKRRKAKRLFKMSNSLGYPYYRKLLHN